MPFTNPIVGGRVLIREAIQSPDYAPGVAGWTINRDGSAEFNNGVFRGDLEVNDGLISIGSDDIPAWIGGSAFPVSSAIILWADVAHTHGFIIGAIPAGSIASFTIAYFDNATEMLIPFTNFDGTGGMGGTVVRLGAEAGHTGWSIQNEFSEDALQHGVDGASADATLTATIPINYNNVGPGPIAFTPAAGWSIPSGDNLIAMVKPTGVTHITGRITKATAPANGETIATVPAGAGTPTDRVWAPSARGSGATSNQKVRVNTDGTISVFTTDTTAGDVIIDVEYPWI